MSNRIHIEPPYECEYCGTYMHYTDIRHTVEIRNESPKYFCSIGCYYGWSSEGEMVADAEDYDH
jgi:hypothetical protein